MDLQIFSPSSFKLGRNLVTGTVCDTSLHTDLERPVSQRTAKLDMYVGPIPNDQ